MCAFRVVTTNVDHLVRRPLLLIAVVVVVIAGIGIGRTASDDTRALCAEFTDASGLFEGNAVAMLGKKVGSVASGVHQNKGQSGVRIDMRVDKSVPLSADVGATLVSTSIVTNVRSSSPSRTPVEPDTRRISAFR